MPNSLLAFSATFSTSPMALSSFNPMSHSICNVNALRSVGISAPVLAASSSQWRSRMPGLRSDTMSGTLGRNTSTSSRTCAAMTLTDAKFMRSNVFADLARLRSSTVTAFSTASASRLLNGPFVHVSLLDSHFSAESHRS